MRALTIILSLFLFAAAESRAASCPNTITYSNGAYLKSGSSYYYPSGSYLLSGSSVYYASGSYLKSGSSFYLKNGSYFISSTSIYYPNGSYFKSGSSLYYANGAYWKSGSSFYYKNGGYARSGSKLYRENGSETPFPLEMEESFGDYGTIKAFVESDKESVRLDLNKLDSGSDQVRFEMEDLDIGADQLTPGLVVRIRTGAPGENVRLEIKGTDLSCSLEGHEQGSDFEIRHPIADVSVHVKDSRKAAKLRQAIQNALDILKDE